MLELTHSCGDIEQWLSHFLVLRTLDTLENQSALQKLCLYGL